MQAKHRWDGALGTVNVLYVAIGATVGTRVFVELLRCNKLFLESPKIRTSQKMKQSYVTLN